MPSTVKYVVGNTYHRIPELNAKLDRSRRYRKVHDWTLYVDVLEGDPDAIDHIDFHMDPSFYPQVFKHHAPVRVTRLDGTVVWRFATRQQTYAVGFDRAIEFHGRGGSRLVTQYKVRSRNFERDFISQFTENRTQKELGPVELPVNRFGIELELTSGRSDSPDKVRRVLEAQSSREVQVLTGQYAVARSTHEEWKLMGDGSIACHFHRPDCHAFELVSRVLSGPQGLDECGAMVEGLSRVGTVRVNKSMGFHVHIDMSRIGHKNLIAICQNFIKYEDAMDAMMPPSRRSNEYCKSNKEAVPGRTNKERHKALASCRSIDDLCDMMNPAPGERYYKLNLQNIKTGRQNTIEFRQHSSTTSSDKILNWIRFCVWFVANSVRYKAPRSLKDSRTTSEQLDALFEFLIKDRYLSRFYQQRVRKLRAVHGETCCDGCAIEGPCWVDV